MPRYRFQWEAVPRPLLRRLAREMALPGDAVGALAEAYGRRPGAAFVRDNWPVLRDAWLGMDTATRRGVVEELRARGLGDMSLPVRNKAQHQAYLASCRNSSSLREVVLGAFHALGDGGPGRPVEQGGAPARDVRGAVAVADPWEAAVIDAWGEFAVRVEAALRALPEQDLVEFRLPERAVGGQQVRAELWFRALPGGALEAGVMTEGNVVELGDLFDAAQISTLDELGWVVSRVSAGGEPEPVRAQLRGDRAGAERLALVAVAAMRQVFGTVHPSFVTAGGRWPSAGGGAEDDDLVAEDAYSGPNRQGTIVHDVGGAEGLRALVDRALAEMLGAEAWHDEDGDVPIDLGGSTCYVRARRTARS